VIALALLQHRKQEQRLNALGSRASAYPSNWPFSKEHCKSLPI
jgi:hypothetical protein